MPENPAAINATLPAQTGVQTGVLLPNPDSPTCEVGIAAELTNGSLALQDPAQPTASPVPSLVSGQLSLQLANLQTTDLQVRCLPGGEILNPQGGLIFFASVGLPEGSKIQEIVQWETLQNLQQAS